MSKEDIRAAMRRGSAPRDPIAFGAGIRSYVLAPYKLVKDLRTGVESHDTDAVLDGDLDKFIEAGLVWRAEQQRNPDDPSAAAGMATCDSD